MWSEKEARSYGQQLLLKIKNILTSAITSLGVVILPRASYYLEHGENEKFEDMIKKAMNFVVLAAVPVTAYFLLFAKEGIYFLSGSAYAGSIIPMRIIMPTVLFIGMTNITGIQILVPLGKEKTVMYSVIVGAVADTIINLLLIPQYSASGAAAGTLVAEIIVWVVQYTVLSKQVKGIYGDTNIGVIFLGTFLGCVSSAWIKNIQIGNFGKLLLAAVIFFGVYFVFLFIGKEKLVRGFFASIKKKI